MQPKAEETDATYYPWWFVLFLAAMVIVPIPFGANRPWASDSFGVLIALCCLGLGSDLMRGRIGLPSTMPWPRLALSVAALAIVIIWAFVQTTDWVSCCDAIWRNAELTLGLPAHPSLSFTPDRAPESVLRMLSYAGCFILALFGCRDSTRAGLMLRILAIAAVAYAFYGLIAQLGMPTILWYKKWAYVDFVTSSFVNKNSYATYAGMGLLCCLGLFWRQLKKKPKIDLAKQSPLEAWLEKIFRHDIFYLLMTLLVLVALLMTGSRAGMAAGLTGGIALVTGLAVNRGWNARKALIIVIPALVIIIAFMVFGSDNLNNRLAASTIQNDTSIRVSGYTIGWRAFVERPMTGYGLGSFEGVFRMFRDSSVRDWIDHAHNDYLELAIELGAPAALLLLIACMLPITLCLNGISSRKRHEIFPVVAVAASVLVGLHSMFDFSMQIPAVAATYFAILGMGVAQSTSSRD